MNSDAPSLRKSPTLSLSDATALVFANQRGLSVSPELVRKCDALIRLAGQQIAARLEVQK